MEEKMDARLPFLPSLHLLAFCWQKYPNTNNPYKPASGLFVICKDLCRPAKLKCLGARDERTISERKILAAKLLEKSFVQYQSDQALTEKEG